MSTHHAILYTDTDKELTEKLCDILKDIVNCQAFHAKSLDQILSLIDSKSVQLIVFEVNHKNEEESFATLTTICTHHPAILIIPVINDNHPETLNRIISRGFFHYITSSYALDEVKIILKRAATAIAKKPSPKDTSKFNSNGFHGLIGNSTKMQKLYNLITRVAEDDFSTVLIRGESGTGKELVAKAIHAHSERKKNNFVPVNCAAIPDDLLESELFGHVKGAFTGAMQNKQGRIQYANGGTLFLDEIGDMKSSLQAKLLRVLQEKEFEPVGALKAVPVDTRIVAATHQDLEKLVNDGLFREDLYYRLCVIPVTIPSLRNRHSDILLLLEEFIKRYASQRKRKPFTISENVKQCLLSHKWKGNVRELENFVQHMSILHCGEHLTTEDLPEKYQSQQIQAQSLHDVSQPSNVLPDEKAALHRGFFEDIPPPSLPPEMNCVNFNELIGDYESKLIVQAMKTTAGNKKEAAKLLGLKRTTLLEKIKKKNLAGQWDS